LDVPEHLCAGKSKYHGVGCRYCVSYDECVKLKTNIEESEYCHFQEKGFKHVGCEKAAQIFEEGA